jgi:trimethylamine monooxygenase
VFSLWSNGPKELVECVKYTFDQHFGHPTPSYQPRSVVYDYLTGRAKLGDIRKFIRFQTAVRNVNYDNEQFEVTVENLPTNVQEHLTFDHMIVAPGRYSTPNIPEFDGMNEFPGRTLHAQAFRDASEFINQHVLIVGSSYAAEDIALQLYKFGARAITVSYRSRPMGYKWPDNKITEVPLLMRMEGRIAHFKNGTTSDTEIDAIILCTGYKHNYPFMAKNLRLECESSVLYPPHLYKGVFWNQQPKLVYLGMQSLVFQFTMYDMQAEYVRDVILGRVTLPVMQTRQENIDEWRAHEAKIEPGDGRAQFYFQIDYMRDMLKQCHSPPQFDVDRVIAGIQELVKHKLDNILTYRDHSFASVVTGERAPMIADRLPWLRTVDDSLEGFLNLKTTTETNDDSRKMTHSEAEIGYRWVRSVSYRE